MAELPNSNDLMHAIQAYQTEWKNTYNYRGEVAKRYINTKDEEIAELKRKLEESERKRQEVEKEMENIKKYRKDLLNVAMVVWFRSTGPTYTDHKDKLVVAVTNLYNNLNDICKDYTGTVCKWIIGPQNERRPANKYDITQYIRKSQYGIDARVNGSKKRGYITKQKVEPTIHKVEMDKVMDRHTRKKFPDHLNY